MSAGNQLALLVEGVRQRYLDQLASLPHLGDVAAPNERERNAQARQKLESLVSMLNQIAARIARLVERRAAPHNAPWRDDCLIPLRDERQQQLAALEARPRETDRQARQRQDREEDALRAELDIITNGVRGEFEMAPVTLVNACRERGFPPEANGTIFMSRGGLLAVTERIDAIDRERRELEKQLEQLTA